MTLPMQFKPRSVGDFYGPARQIAGLIQNIVSTARANGNAPIKLLLNGPPGTGKSALADFTIGLLGVSKWSLDKHNGTRVGIELINDLAYKTRTTNMFGDWQVFWWEEADKFSPAAQCGSLTLLDDLPPGFAVIATSNCKLSDFEERWQTRFQVFEVAGPQAADMAALLRRFTQDEVVINQIATFACGNVRSALTDVQTSLLSAASA